MTTMLKWLLLMAFLGAGVVALASCGVSLDDAIARAEADGATSDRALRQDLIETLQAALAEPDQTNLQAEARSWLGHLLVRHGRIAEAKELLADFGPSVDELIANGKAAAAVRGLTAYGTALWYGNFNIEALIPVDRAIAVAKDHLAKDDPLLVAALLQGVRVRIWWPDADGLPRSLLDKAIGLVADRETNPDIILAEAMLLWLALSDLRVKGAERDAVISTQIALLERANQLYAKDHPLRVTAMLWLGEWSARSCDLNRMHRMYEEAVALAQEIYGPRGHGTFGAIDEYGHTLMSVGLVTRGLKKIIDARRWRYGPDADGLTAPTPVWEMAVPCIDPPI